MNVSVNAQSRVLFGVEGTYFASVDSTGITTDTIECVNDCSIGTSSGGAPFRIPSILSNIQNKARDLPINSGTASPSNIADNAVTLNKISTSSLPLTVSRGGTGIANIGEGRILVGSGTDGQGQALPLTTPLNVKVDNSNSIVEIKGDLTIGGNNIGIRNDVYGRPTLSCVPYSSSNNLNLIAPGLDLPKCSMSVTYSNLKMDVTLNKTGGFPVHVFVVVSRSNIQITKSSIVNNSRLQAIDFASSRVPFRGNVVTVSFNTPLTSTYNIYGVMGDARGTLSEISSSKMPAPFYRMGTSTLITNGIGSQNIGIQSDKLSNSEPIIVMSCLFTLSSGNYGFEMGFKSFSSTSSAHSSAGVYHSFDKSLTGPNKQVTTDTDGPANAPVEAVMRYVRSENRVYFTAKNILTDVEFVKVNVSNTTWNTTGTHAGIRTFFGPMVIQKFDIAYM